MTQKPRYFGELKFPKNFPRSGLDTPYSFHFGACFKGNRILRDPRAVRGESLLSMNIVLSQLTAPGSPRMRESVSVYFRSVPDVIW